MTNNQPKTNFAQLILNQSISLGQVCKNFTGEKAPTVYFAGLNGKGRLCELSNILTRGDVVRESILSGDEALDKEVYALLIQSPWFPLSTGVTPQAALINFTDKINQPWLSNSIHLLPILVDKVVRRWVDRRLKDDETGRFKFHLDMMFVVPETEKGWAPVANPLARQLPPPEAL